MEDVLDFFSNLFSSEGFIPRWVCGEWTDFHGWLYIISDFLIWLAYFAIPALLFYFIVKKKNRFQQVFWWFIAFILFCGLTHIIEVVIFWYPVYRLAALMKFFTAFVSIATVFILMKYLPTALKAKSVGELEVIIDQKIADLQIVNENLSHEKTKLKKKNRSLEDVQYIVSHNLRSPIGNMQSLLEMCKTDDEDAKATAVEKLDEVLEKMQNTVDELNHVVQSTNQDSPDTLVNIPELFSDTKMSLSEKISEAKAEFKTNFEVKEIIYSALHLESYFQNFISNSLKYRSEDRPLLIKIGSYKTKEGSVVLVFEDNGIGIDLEKHGDSLFKYGKTFHEHEDARGVGLYLTKRQIEDRDGKIEVESEIDGGTTFRIYLSN